MNLEAAVAFVKREGNAVEHARLARVLEHARPTADAIAALVAGQRDDGGWPPFWAPDYSSVDATCFRLAQAEQLGVTRWDPAVARAVAFLGARQRPDGSWEEEEAVASLAPSWAKPGDLAATLYLTSNCGFWSAMLADTDDAALRAAVFLQAHREPNGDVPGFPQTLWLAGGLWYRLQWRGPAEQILNHLGGQVEDMPAGNLAWMIITLRMTGVPASHFLLESAASLLEHHQKQDGRWSSADGPAHDVHATLEALRALRLCGRY